MADISGLLSGFYDKWKAQPQMAAMGGLLSGDTNPMMEYLGVGQPWPNNAADQVKQGSYNMAMDLNNPMASVPLIAGINKMNVPSEDILEILKRIKKTGGDSVSLNSLTRPKSGYMVAPSKSTERILPADSLTKQQIEQYINDFHGLLGQPNNHFGAWVDNGNVYLDVSKNVPKQWKAKKDAINADQEAIWDMMNMRGIRTK